MPGQVHLAHPAGSQLPDDGEAGERRTFRERHGGIVARQEGRACDTRRESWNSARDK
ncbi:Uncharacterised protein [Mycobacterium tuberculosis]|nr:Uncharacterised protein [Mycobacterium tuberculosis]